MHEAFKNSSDIDAAAIFTKRGRGCAAVHSEACHSIDTGPNGH